MTNEDMTTDLESEGLDLRRYFFLLLQWIWLIILVAVLAGGAAYYFNSSHYASLSGLYPFVGLQPGADCGRVQFDGYQLLCSGYLCPNADEPACAGADYQ